MTVGGGYTTLGKAFRRAERVARERHAVGPVLFRSTDGWEVSGSVKDGDHRREVRVRNVRLEDALTAFAEQMEALP